MPAADHTPDTGPSSSPSSSSARLGVDSRRSHSRSRSMDMGDRSPSPSSPTSGGASRPMPIRGTWFDKPGQSSSHGSLGLDRGEHLSPLPEPSMSPSTSAAARTGGASGHGHARHASLASFQLGVGSINGHHPSRRRSPSPLGFESQTLSSSGSASPRIGSHRRTQSRASPVLIPLPSSAVPIPLPSHATAGSPASPTFLNAQPRSPSTSPPPNPDPSHPWDDVWPGDDDASPSSSAAGAISPRRQPAVTTNMASSPHAIPISTRLSSPVPPSLQPALSAAAASPSQTTAVPLPCRPSSSPSSSSASLGHALSCSPSQTGGGSRAWSTSPRSAHISPSHSAFSRHAHSASASAVPSSPSLSSSPATVAAGRASPLLRGAQSSPGLRSAADAGEGAVGKWMPGHERRRSTASASSPFSSTSPLSPVFGGDASGDRQAGAATSFPPVPSDHPPPYASHPELYVDTSTLAALSSASPSPAAEHPSSGSSSPSSATTVRPAPTVLPPPRSSSGSGLGLPPLPSSPGRSAGGMGAALLGPALKASPSAAQTSALNALAVGSAAKGEQEGGRGSRGGSGSRDSDYGRLGEEGNRNEGSVPSQVDVNLDVVMEGDAMDGGIGGTIRAVPEAEAGDDFSPSSSPSPNSSDANATSSTPTSPESPPKVRSFISLPPRSGYELSDDPDDWDEQDAEEGVGEGRNGDGMKESDGVGMEEGRSTRIGRLRPSASSSSPFASSSSPILGLQAPVVDLQLTRQSSRARVAGSVTSGTGSRKGSFSDSDDEAEGDGDAEEDGGRGKMRRGVRDSGAPSPPSPSLIGARARNARSWDKLGSADEISPSLSKSPMSDSEAVPSPGSPGSPLALKRPSLTRSGFPSVPPPPPNLPSLSFGPGSGSGVEQSSPQTRRPGGGVLGYFRDDAEPVAGGTVGDDAGEDGRRECEEEGGSREGGLGLVGGGMGEAMQRETRKQVEAGLGMGMGVGVQAEEVGTGEGERFEESQRSEFVSDGMSLVGAPAPGGDGEAEFERKARWAFGDAGPEQGEMCAEDVLDEQLSTLERIFLFAKSEMQFHRVLVSQLLYEWVKGVDLCDAVEYVLPLLNGLGTDEPAVCEALAPELDRIMWFFLRNCPLIEVEQDNDQIDQDEPKQAPAAPTPSHASADDEYKEPITQRSEGTLASFDSAITAVECSSTSRKGSVDGGQMTAIDESETVRRPRLSVATFSPLFCTLLLSQHASIAASAQAALVRCLVRLGGQPVAEEEKYESVSSDDPIVDVVISSQGQGREGRPLRYEPYAFDERARREVERELLDGIVLAMARLDRPDEDKDEDMMDVELSVSAGRGSPTKVDVEMDHGEVVKDEDGKKGGEQRDAEMSEADGFASPSVMEALFEKLSQDEENADEDDSSVDSDMHDESQRMDSWMSPFDRSSSPIISPFDQPSSGLQNDADEEAAVGRMATLSLIAAIAAEDCIRSDEVMAKFVAQVEAMKGDPIFFVRKEAVAAMGALAKVVQPDVVAERFAPALDDFVSDKIWHVRQMTALALPSLCKPLPPDVRRSRVVQTVRTFSNDVSKNVRSAILEVLGELIYLFHGDAKGVPRDLVRFFLGKPLDQDSEAGQDELTASDVVLDESFRFGESPRPFNGLDSFINPFSSSPSERGSFMNGARPESIFGGSEMGFYRFNDTERPLITAFNIPAVVLTLGPQRWSLLREQHSNLSRETPNVRRTIAASLHEIAKIIGPDAAERDLLPAFVRFMRDEPEIKATALEHMDVFFKALPREAGEHQIMELKELWGLSFSKDWRMRHTVAQHLHSLAEQFLLDDEGAGLLGLLELALHDDVAAVRHAAVSSVPFLYLTLAERDQVVADGFLGMISDIGARSSYRDRTTCLACCLALVEQRIERSAFELHLMHRLIELGSDPIVNVRIALARTLGLMCRLDELYASPQSRSPQLSELLLALSRDASSDVRYYVSELFPPGQCRPPTPTEAPAQRLGQPSSGTTGEGRRPPSRRLSFGPAPGQFGANGRNAGALERSFGHPMDDDSDDDGDDEGIVADEDMIREVEMNGVGDAGLSIEPEDEGIDIGVAAHVPRPLTERRRSERLSFGDDDDEAEEGGSGPQHHLLGVYSPVREKGFPAGEGTPTRAGPPNGTYALESPGTERVGGKEEDNRSVGRTGSARPPSVSSGKPAPPPLTIRDPFLAFVAHKRYEDGDHVGDEEAGGDGQRLQNALEALRSPDVADREEGGGSPSAGGKAVGRKSFDWGTSWAESSGEAKVEEAVGGERRERDRSGSPWTASESASPASEEVDDFVKVEVKEGER